jgi:hypothetical protein
MGAAWEITSLADVTMPLGVLIVLLALADRHLVVGANRLEGN